MRQIYIHIGYPKAASTWLQSRIFVENNRFQIPWRTHANRAIERFGWTNPIRFDPAAVRREFDSALEGDAGDPVLSHEALSGDPVRGLYWGFEVAERLAACFPDGRVLLCVRNQIDFAYSVWSEYVARGGVLGIEKYLNSSLAPAGYRSFCPSEYLDFGELAQHYVNMFGKENVFILPIESLTLEPTRAMGLLGEFLGRSFPVSLARERVYPGLKGATQRFLLWANRHISPYDPTQISSRRRIRIIAAQLNRRLPANLHAAAKAADKKKAASIVNSRHAASNRLLQAFTQFDLRALGYAS